MLGLGRLVSVPQCALFILINFTLTQKKDQTLVKISKIMLIHLKYINLHKRQIRTWTLEED